MNSKRLNFYAWISCVLFWLFQYGLRLSFGLTLSEVSVLPSSIIFKYLIIYVPVTVLFFGFSAYAFRYITQIAARFYQTHIVYIFFALHCLFLSKPSILFHLNFSDF